MKGKVYLVGAGPGDPGLLTLKARNCLQKATVVVYDHLVNEQLLGLIPKETELIYAGKKAGKHSLSQKEINQLICRKAKQGHIVVRLKGGDPFLFGRGGEEAEALAKARVKFEIVPGIPSPLAASAYAGIPVTHREYSSELHILTGHQAPEKKQGLINWQNIAQSQGTIILMMSVMNLSSIAKELIKQGKPADTPVAAISWGSTPEQKTIVSSLGKIAKHARTHGLKPPAIIVIGQCVNLRKRLNWFESLPLFGKQILATWPIDAARSDQRQHALDLLGERGAAVIHIPAIKISPSYKISEVKRQFNRMGQYHWLLFTSANGVRIFMELLEAMGKDARFLAKLKIGVIGRATSDALHQYGIRADFVPYKFTQKDMGRTLCIKRGEKVLIPRAKNVPDSLGQELKKKGAIVKLLPLYKIEPDKPGLKKIKDMLSSQSINAIIFTASSAVNYVLQQVSAAKIKAAFKHIVIVSIGPETTKALQQFKLNADVQPKKYTVEALAIELLRFFKQKGGK